MSIFLKGLQMIIAFLHPKGGVGKSLLSFNFAIFKMLKNKEVDFIDLDGQHSIQSFNQIRLQDENLKPLNIKTFETSDDLIAFLQNVTNENIIIDTGGFDSAFNRVVLAFADVVITPTSDSPIELKRLSDFTQIVNGVSRKINRDIKVKVLLNRIHPSVKSLDNIKELFANNPNFSFLDNIVRDRVRIKNSISSGRSVFEETGALMDVRAIDELTNVFNEIENISTKG